MKMVRPPKKYVTAAVVFALVAVGVYAAVPGHESKSESLVPVVVVSRKMEEGTSSATVRANTSVRLVPPNARVSTAITSVDSIPDGILAYVHLGGQQLLSTSFAQDRVGSLGPGYVAVSVKLDTQRWAGPVLQSGRHVDVWDTDDAGPKMVATDAVILDPPEPTGAKADVDTVITLGVKKESVAGVLLAAANEHVWLVSR